MTKMYFRKSSIYYVMCGLSNADYILFNILELRMYLTLFENHVHPDTFLKNKIFVFSINVSGQ